MVRDDQEASGPTSAAARHKCRTGQLFQLRTGTARFIRQEGTTAIRMSSAMSDVVPLVRATMANAAQVIHHREPEFGPFVVGDPKARNLRLAFWSDAWAT
jgi:hypothetical protein